MDKLGGFWIRLGARLLDGLLMAGIIYILIAIFSLDTQSTVIQMSELVIMILYFILLPVLWFGHTAGKWALGIRIIRDDGSQVNFVDMLVREVLAGLLYGVTLGIALIVSAFMIGLRKDKKAIHDLIAKTRVIYGRA